MPNELWIASYILLWLVVVVLGFMTAGLLRQLGLLQLRLGVDPGVLITSEGLVRGTPAPLFEALDIDTKRTLRLQDLLQHRVILVFLAPTCLACRQLVPHLTEIAQAYRDDAEVLAVCQGTQEACSEFKRGFGLRVRTVVDPVGTISAQYGVKYTPFAYLVDSDGTVLIRGVVNSWPQLEALLNEEGTFQEHPWQQVPSNSAAVDDVRR